MRVNKHIINCVKACFTTGLLANAGFNSASAAPLAKSADSFVDSIGVGVHLTYGDTPYARFDDLIKPKLQQLGIRHIRDGGHNEPDYLNKIKALASVGIKSQLIFQGTPPNEVLEVLKKVPGAVDAVEGPNESDLEQNNFAYKGQKFPSGTRNYQKELHYVTKGDPTTKNLPIILPSVGWGENADKAGLLGDLGDYCNLHSYPALANKPTHDIDSYFIPHAKNMCGDKPLMVTETGYHNAVNDPEDGSGISEIAASKYLTRMLLENFNRNIKRTFLYEFIDESSGSDREASFGLLRYDGSAKPAYTAIKNIISVLKSKQTDFKPVSLDYTLSGNHKSIRSTLLQKSDGTFFLILWQDADSWNSESKKDIAVAALNVKLSLANTATKIEIYDPLKSTSATKTLADVKDIQVQVPDSPIIVKLTTKAGSLAATSNQNPQSRAASNNDQFSPSAAPSKQSPDAGVSALVEPEETSTQSESVEIESENSSQSEEIDN